MHLQQLFTKHSFYLMLWVYSLALKLVKQGFFTEAWKSAYPYRPSTVFLVF